MIHDSKKTGTLHDSTYFRVLVSDAAMFFFVQSVIQRSWQLTDVVSGAFFCRADEFICNNTLCKLHTWVCDGKDDCGDNSDEDADMCGGLKLSLTNTFL